MPIYIYLSFLYLFINNDKYLGRYLVDTLPISWDHPSHHRHPSFVQASHVLWLARQRTKPSQTTTTTTAIIEIPPPPPQPPPPLPPLLLYQYSHHLLISDNLWPASLSHICTNSKYYSTTPPLFQKLLHPGPLFFESTINLIDRRNLRWARSHWLQRHTWIIIIEPNNWQ